MLRPVAKESGSNVFLHVVVFEDTIILRTNDIEFSDEIEVELWVSFSIF